MDKLVIGIVRKTHGVKGYLKAASTSGETGHFLSLKTVELAPLGGTASSRGNAPKRTASKENAPGGAVPAGTVSKGRTLEIEDVKVLGRGEILMKFRGYDSPEAARVLAPAEILAPRDQAAPLKRGEFYQADLIGCRVVSGEKVLGVVEAVSQGGQSDLLEVRTEGGVFLVPFMRQYVGAVDTAGKTLELLAEWLLQ